jgi:hypothetical protein
MKVRERLHLTYCSNIHSGETWPEVNAALADALPRVRRELAFDGPFAIGLRLSAQAAATLHAPAVLDRLRRFLDDGNYYVPTINGFPFGAFHGTRVKENVYLPDWRSAERVEYTNQLATILARLLADRTDVEASVSTVPGAFRAHVKSVDDEKAIAAGILRHAAHLVRLREETGVTVALALEPEPACYLETVADVVKFFDDHLLDAGARAAVDGAALTGDEVRRHVGVCYDACHGAVEFEEPAASLGQLDDAGIRVCKVQVSSALRVSGSVGALSTALAPFADATYLHQVVRRTSHGLERFTDLPDALERARGEPTVDRGEWRIHYHVPIFLDHLGALQTTQSELVAALDAIKRTERGLCVEVETYTWDVLPAEYRTVDLCTAIARELTWARRQLES